MSVDALEQVRSRIMQVRGQKVILDSDLAELYEVKTGALNQAVKRNADRFPADFVFQLTTEESGSLRCHFGTSSLTSQNVISSHGGRRHLPNGFTQGRRSVRLPMYDYSSEGTYFITICTRDRLCLFGRVANGEMVLNPNGVIVKRELLRTPMIRKEISLDAWMIMPNHIHAIVIINESGDVGAQGLAPLRETPGDDGITNHIGAQGLAPLQSLPRPSFHRKPRSLSSFVAGFKSSVTTRLNESRNTPGQPVWQRNYWEHIIRNDNSYETIRQYILENPRHWASDEENPSRM